MHKIFRWIRYGTVGAFCAGIFSVITAFSDRDSILLTLLLFLLQFCSHNLDVYTVEITIEGTGSGSVTSVPALIDCGADCVADFLEGLSVSLIPTALAGSAFAGWSGDADCTDGVLLIDADKACTATFNLATHTLTVTLGGAGTGTVSSAPAGINCGADCTEAYTSGTVVTLTPTGLAGSAFDNWTGDPDCADGVVTMDAAKTCTANFIPPL